MNTKQFWSPWCWPKATRELPGPEGRDVPDLKGPVRAAQGRQSLARDHPPPPGAQTPLLLLLGALDENPKNHPLWFSVNEIPTLESPDKKTTFRFTFLS